MRRQFRERLRSLALIFRPPFRSYRRRAPPQLLRGNMHRVLTVSAPGEMFSQAIFILKDEYFQTPGVSRQELLHQAKLAAEDYLDTSVPQGSSTPTFPSAVSIFVLGAACTIMALWLLGFLGKL